MTSLLKRIFGRGEADCLEIRELASDYLEHGLASRKRAALQRHLDKCGPCKAFVETLSATIGVLARLPRMNSPASFKQSVMSRIRAEEAEEPS